MSLAVVDGFRYHSKIDPMLLMQHGIVDVSFRPTLIQDSFLRTMGWFGLRIGPLSEISESSWDARLLEVTRMAIMKPATGSKWHESIWHETAKGPGSVSEVSEMFILENLRFQWFGWGIVLHSDERIEAKATEDLAGANFDSRRLGAFAPAGISIEHLLYMGIYQYLEVRT